MGQWRRWLASESATSALRRPYALTDIDSDGVFFLPHVWTLKAVLTEGAAYLKQYDSL